MKKARLTTLILLLLVSLVVTACGDASAPAAQPATAAAEAPAATEPPAATEEMATATEETATDETATATEETATATDETGATETPAATETAISAEGQAELDALLARDPEAYDPPIDLSTVGVNVLSTVVYAPGDDVNNNPWTRALEEKYGINVNTLWTVDQAQWEERTNLMIASGDLPDFFQASAVQLNQLAEAGLIQDLTEVYNTEASAELKTLLTEGGEYPMRSATIDGRLMAIPYTGLPKEGVPILYVRTDWLKKLNLEEPRISCWPTFSGSATRVRPRKRLPTLPRLKGPSRCSMATPRGTR